MTPNVADRQSSKDGAYLVIDESNCKQGITDRLKVAVGLCYLARRAGVPFKFIHTAGFDLRDYLKPNLIDWSAEPSDLCDEAFENEEICYLPPFDDLPKFEPNRRYVCKTFIGKNAIEMSGVPEWERVWRELFWEMFAPTDRVLDALARNRSPERYAVVNARFVNSLGFFEDSRYFNEPFPPETQAKIIDATLDKVGECAKDFAKESDAPIFVFSDSVRFLDAAAERGFLTCDSEGIGHIMNDGVDELVYLRTFVNLFWCARAEKIYSILNVEGVPEKSLYKTQFPRYAAIVGDRPFVRL